uniref:Uncharacterized protein n=1 Tax=Sphaerodactylus townsendi TaxID=933632 RepID=A0ACB8GEG9_9SAUR
MHVEMSREMKKQSGLVWEEERQTSQRDEHKVRAKWKNASAIPAFLLSLLFAPPNWCLKKMHLQRLTALLTTLKKSAD